MCNNNSRISTLEKYWTTERRRTTWYVMASSRKILKIKIDPVITTAFTYLQNIIRLSDHHDIPLFIVIAASLSAAGKNRKQKISLTEIINALLRVIHTLPPVPKDILMQDLDINILKNVSLLKDIIKQLENYILCLPEHSAETLYPFDFLPQINQELSQHISMKKISEALVINLCSIVCNENCPLLPAELCAAAAYNEARKMFTTNDESPFLSQCVNKYGRDCLSFVENLIQKENGLTVKP